MKTSKTKKMNMGGAACGPKKMANGGSPKSGVRSGSKSFTGGGTNVRIDKRKYTTVTARPKVGVKVTKEPTPYATNPAKTKVKKSTREGHKNVRNM